MGTVQTKQRRDAPFIVFRGRPVDPDSIFCKGIQSLILQMDVWSQGSFADLEKDEKDRDEKGESIELKGSAGK